jgi:hypothetical protein
MKVTTYNDKNITSIISDSVRVTIEEDDKRVYITIAEKVRTEEGDSYDVTVEEITNNLSITKARELDLEIID